MNDRKDSRREGRRVHMSFVLWGVREFNITYQINKPAKVKLS
jgi:hypothetical protein